MTGYGTELLTAVTGGTRRELLAVRELPARAARTAEFPEWVPPEVREAVVATGVRAPWRHQTTAAEMAHSGRHVVVATGTASGKSLAYQLPVLSRLFMDPRATALYLSPTKALGNDQLRAIGALLHGRREFIDIGPCAYDGDTPTEVRAWARSHSRFVFSNPDMVHMGMLGGAGRWTRFLRGLTFVVVDECHHYRGVFGSHTAHVLRRLLRLARRLGADPTVVAASATTGDPAAALSGLIGAEAAAVTDDASPHGPVTVALWEPDFIPDAVGTHGAPVRRPAGGDAARLLADLVAEGARTLAFVSSRKGAEAAALAARRRLEDVDPQLASRIAAYRAGYLADDRRRIERDLSDGSLLGVATTNALELGVDIAGLDAVVLAGFPGTLASFWQQAGRCGRRGEGSLVTLVARDDPLDTYLVHHPEALLDRPVEATITDPSNPYVLRPHLLCAAAEAPIGHDEAAELGVVADLEALAADGLLRRRPAGWYVAAGVQPHADVDIRGGIGGQVLIVDDTSAELLGTVDHTRSMSQLHPGAVYLHRGATYLVDSLDLDDGIALVHPDDPDYSTSAQSDTSITITSTLERVDRGPVSMRFVEIEVTSRVTGFLRRGSGGDVLSSTPLDMPPHTLPTRAALYTIEPEALEAAGLAPEDWPGALHAAEHAAIGLLPLVATCDRWDIGGLSTDLHADTGLPSVFVYDGYPGGAGFAERGHRRFIEWLTATRAAIIGCGCRSGCPSCVQSPKCGNGNEPLDKAGAVTVLSILVDA